MVEAEFVIAFGVNKTSTIQSASFKLSWNLAKIF